MAFIKANKYNYDIKLGKELNVNIPIPIVDCVMNNTSVNKYIELINDHGDNEVAQSIQTIIDNTEHINFEEFCELIVEASKKFQSFIGDRKYIAVCSGEKKSEIWVMRIVHKFNNSLFKGLEKIIFLDDLNNIEIPDDIHNIVFFDDGLFSGIHMIGMIESFYSLTSRNIDINIICGIITNIAISNIRYSMEPYFYYGKMITNSISNLLDEDKINELKIFYELPEGDNELQDQFPVYFDHKMPDMFSGLPFLYRGLTPYGISVPLLDGCPIVPYRKQE